ncbi:hypothetical protein N9D31_00470 [Oligoflexaceae bacterium]|nr:hypothetical protein [Oligoflexaceae bacterium]
MKFLSSLIIAIFLITSAAQAAESRYQMKSMECIGKINQKPKNMQPDYVYIGLRLIQFKSKKKDGSFADSLGWNTYYGKTRGEVVQDLVAKQNGGESWFTGTLKTRRLNGETFVYRNLRGEKFIGKLLKGSNKHRDYVSARYVRSLTVVGNYFYELNCRAYK